MEEIQLEVQSLIYTASLDAIERACKFFKVEFEGKKSLVIVKELCSSLEKNRILYEQLMSLCVTLLNYP